MRRSDYEVLRLQTNNMALVWKESRGIAPDSVADKLDDAMLKWMSELTDTLKIWIDKGFTMTDGELILARTNMGALVESWLKLFYCVYYEDYMKNPLTQTKKGKTITDEPNNMRFEDLKNFSKGILWDDDKDPLYVWVDKIQHYRNAVHAFNYRDIGTAKGFMSDMEEFYRYVNHILDHLPPIEDLLPCYPAGYVMNVYFD